MLSQNERNNSCICLLFSLLYIDYTMVQALDFSTTSSCHFVMTLNEWCHKLSSKVFTRKPFLIICKHSNWHLVAFRQNVGLRDFSICFIFPNQNLQPSFFFFKTPHGKLAFLNHWAQLQDNLRIIQLKMYTCCTPV